MTKVKYYKFAKGDQVRVDFKPPTNGIVVSKRKKPDFYNVRLEGEANDVVIHASKMTRN